MSTLFPTTEVNYINENTRTEGATLLDGFAMAALQGILASHPVGVSFESDAIAQRAYRLARAMLRARD